MGWGWEIGSGGGQAVFTLLVTTSVRSDVRGPSVYRRRATGRYDLGVDSSLNFGRLLRLLWFGERLRTTSFYFGDPRL